MNDIEDKEKEAIAYAQVAFYTLQNSANKYNITPAALGLEMETIFKLHDKKQILARATEIFNNFNSPNMPLEDNKIAITIDEARNILDLGRNSMLKLVDAPGFPSMRVGGRILINKSKLKQWFDENCK